MPQATTSFNVMPYVPNRFVWGFAISLVSIYALAELNIWLLVISVVLSAICITAQYRVEVNTSEKWFREFTWVLGLKIGDVQKYSTLEYLFINRGKVTQTTASRVSSTTVTKDEFRGFIKFDGDEKIHILTNSSYEKLKKKMTKAAQKLHAPLFDYSYGQTIQLV